MTTRPIPVSPSLNISGMYPPLILGLVGAVLGVVFVLAHWSFALLGGIAVVVLAAAENEAFLLAMVFLIPINWIATVNVPLGSDAGRFDVATTVRLLVVAGFLVGRLIRDPHAVGETLKAPLTKLSLLFVAATLASVILGGYGLSYSGLKAMVRLLSYVGFYMLVVLWVNSRGLRNRVAITVMASTIFAALFGIFQEIMGNYTSLWLYLNPPNEFSLDMDNRAPSFFGNCNFFAGYLNLVLPFSLACWFLGEGKWKKFGAWTTGLGIVALLCTQSLGAIGSFWIVAVVAILCFGGTWKRKLGLLGAVFAVTMGFYVAREVLNPAHEGTAFAYDQAMRLVLWGIALDFFRQSPVLGVGWGNFVELYGSYAEGISWLPAGQFAAHNLYLQLLAETGLAGFGAFSWLIFHSAKQAVHQFRRSVHVVEKALAFGVLGAVFTTLMHGFVDFFFHASPQFGTLFWVLLALLVVSGKGLGEAVAVGGAAVDSN